MSLLKRLESAQAGQQIKNANAAVTHAKAASLRQDDPNFGDIFSTSGLNIAAPTWRGHNPALDSRAVIGNPLENSLVFAALDYQAKAFCKAPFVVKTRDAQGVEKIIYDHPLATLLKRPARDWSRQRFFRASLLSLFFSGNSYWHKVRTTPGGPVEALDWLHWRQVKPVANPTTGRLSHYEYQSKSGKIEISPDDIVHIRDGVNPDNTLEGFSRFRALAPHIATDAKITRYENIFLNNFGIAGAIFSPPSGERIRDDDAEVIKTRYDANTTGNETGGSMVFPTPIKIDYQQTRPSDFGLEHLHASLEARVASVMNFPAVVLQMLFAIKSQSSKAGFKDMEAMAWDWNIIPTQELFTEEIDVQLLQTDDFEVGLDCWSDFDRSEVEALKEDRDALSKRTISEFGIGGIDRAELRGKLGYKVRPEDKDVYAKAKASGATDESKKPEEEDAKAEATDDK